MKPSEKVEKLLQQFATDMSSEEPDQANAGYIHIEILSIVQDLEKDINEANEDIIWMSGCDDFSENGKAHEGFLAVRKRLFKRMGKIQD